jgi:hypothetical protein
MVIIEISILGAVSIVFTLIQITFVTQSKQMSDTQNTEVMFNQINYTVPTVNPFLLLHETKKLLSSFSVITRAHQELPNLFHPLLR